MKIRLVAGAPELWGYPDGCEQVSTDEITIDGGPQKPEYSHLL